MRSVMAAVCAALLALTVVTGMQRAAVAAEPAIFGKIYFEYNYQSETGANAFDIDRVYLTHCGALSPVLHYRVTSDITSTGQGYLLLMKYAYVDWVWDGAGDVTAGMIPMNAFDVQKNTWGYRYLQKTVMNHYGFSSSADLGVGYTGRVGEVFSVSAILSNGGGYTQLEMNRGKRLHVRLLLGQEDLSGAQGMNLGFYGSSEWLSGDRTMVTGAAFFGLHTGSAWGGVEVARWQEDRTDFSQTLVSVYGRYRFAGKFMPYLRADLSARELRKERRILTGLEYAPVQGLRVTPNFIVTWMDSGEPDLVTRINTEFSW